MLPPLQRWVLVALFGGTFGAHDGTAQLAITEVMPATRTNPDTAFRGPDYWELTNFGPNDVPLADYGFRDANPSHPLTREPFANLVIHAGESIVFFQWSQSVTNAAQFRAWWGDSKLPPNFQCRGYAEPGLSGWDGDAIRLFDPSEQVVDSVTFARARLGRAFTYDSQTGLFGNLSTAGVDGAVAAELADDVGSPGTTAGPVPMDVLQPPTDQSVDAGMTASFTVIGAGFPRPAYQWFFRDQPIPTGTQPTLRLSNVQPTDAGPYHVRIANALSTATSTVATLFVNTSLTPATIVHPPADAAVFVGQTAVFTVSARGLPALSYEWRTNGAIVLNQIGPRLELFEVGPWLSGLRCSVTVSNALGAAEASALLTVAPRPDLRFTEVMAVPADEEANRHFDWFELTNYHTNEVDLAGWRFADEPSFVQAITITNALILQPGESAVFAERLDRPLFARWWGAEHLPAGLKLFTYSGLGLASFGEVLYLWNPAATDPDDFVASVSWARATPGVSFVCERTFCDPDGHCLDDSTHESVPGELGAFRAVDSGDLGSPGYPPLQILSITQAAGEVRLRCRVRAGGRYRLWRSPSLVPPDWAALSLHTATNNVLTVADPNPPSGPAWFYRVAETP